MATADIVAVEIPDDGYDLVGSTDFETLVPAAGNGVEFAYDPRDLIVLKNTVAGTATFTIKVPTPAAYAAQDITIPDDTVELAAGDSEAQIWLHKVAAIYKQAAETVIIECDVAGEVLVLRK